MNLEVASGLDFLLTHFKEPYFPRTIMTARTNGQVFVNSKAEALRFFAQADYIDCRINAFSEEEINNKTPNLIFIDLDNRDALNEARILIHKTIEGIPTILDTGKGYAILQPIEIETWAGLSHHGKNGKEISKHFLKFAEEYLTNGKADTSNHPSLESCLIRVPGTLNGKYQKVVTIYLEWNKQRPHIKNLPFKQYMQRIIDEESQISKKDLKASPKNFTWIEELMANKIADGRARLLFDVTRYLVNIKGCSIGEAVEKINDWLNSQHYSKSMIELECKKALKDGKYPRRLKTIQNKDKDLFEILSGMVG